MMDTIFILLFAGGFIFVLLWLKRKLEEREAKLSSGETVAQMKSFDYGTQQQLKGKIEIKEKGIWYRVLLDIGIEEELDGRRYHFPKDFNVYSLAIHNNAGKTVYSEKGSLRPFIMNLKAHQQTRSTGIRREKNNISRIGQAILLEFKAKTTGKYNIQYSFQKAIKVATKKYNYKSEIKNIEITIKQDVIPIRSRGEYPHKIVELP